MLTRIDAMRERAGAESSTFTLLIPNEPESAELIGRSRWPRRSSSASRPATTYRQ